jgi:hypothetical protein
VFINLCEFNPRRASESRGDVKNWDNGNSERVGRRRRGDWVLDGRPGLRLEGPEPWRVRERSERKGLSIFHALNPALKCWAIIKIPSRVNKFEMRNFKNRK